HRDASKVEQVSQRIAATLVPDSSFTLNGISWCCVNRHPGLATVVSVGDVNVPTAFKGRGLVIAGFSRTEEGNCGAIWVAGDRRRKYGVVEPLRRADIAIVGPGQTFV